MSPPTDVRIVIELKRGADPQLVMRFCLRTALATTVQFNMTCLVPTENPEIGTSATAGLEGHAALRLDFRFGVVSLAVAPAW